MKVLVPLDGSQVAEAAVPIAMRLAREAMGAFVLLSVVSIRPPHDPSPAETDILQISDAKSYLEAVKSHLMSEVANVQTAVWRGTPVTAIISAAQAYDIDVIVMTSHGRTGMHRDMFGSVAEAVLREAPMQVVVVRPRRDSLSAPAEPGKAVTAAPV